MKDHIILATQGSQGIVALRELFSLGYKLNDISICVCKSQFNQPLISFLEYLNCPFSNIDSSEKFDEVVFNSKVNSLLISVSWKFLISKKALKHLNFKAINFHPGLLPEYKGCFSTPWSLINNEREVGYTYHFMNEKFDCGNILLKESIKIEKNDDAFSLNFKIFQKGLSRLGYVIDRSESNGVPQAKKGKYYANEIPFKGEIDINWPDEFIERYIKAMNFPPHKPAVLKSYNNEYRVTSLDEYKKYRDE